MRRYLIVCFFFLSGFACGQTWSTFATPSSYVGALGSNFFTFRDTLYAPSSGAWTYIFYLNSGNNTWANAMNFDDKHVFAGLFAYNGATSSAYTVYKGWPYLIYGGIYFPGSFWRYDAPMVEVWKNGVATISPGGDLYKLANVRWCNNIIFKDSVFYFGSGYGYGGDNNFYLGKYSLSGHNWTYDRLTSYFGQYNASGGAGPNAYGGFVLDSLVYILSNRDTLNDGAGNAGLNLYRRNADYSWTKLKTFPGIRYCMNADTANGKAYMLLVGNNRNDPDYGIWILDPDSGLTRLTLPNANLIGESMCVNKNELFLGMASSTVPDSNRIYRYYGGKWSSPSVVGNHMDVGQIIRKGNYVYVTAYQNMYRYQASSVTTGNVYRSSDYDMLELTAPKTGEVWQSGDTKTITFTSSVSAWVRISISSDNGLTYTKLDSINATTGNNNYSLTVPEIASNNCYIKVQTVNTPIPVSNVSGKFQVFGDLNISILSVSPSTLDMKTQAGPINIKWTSTFVDSFNIYCGHDTLNWTKIGSQIIAHKHLGIDTSQFNWYPKENISGDLYLKVEEARDTVLYNFPLATVRSVGSRDLGGMICQEQSGNIIEAYTLLDVSCGWVANIGLTYYTKSLTGSWDDLKYNTVSVGCSYPHIKCDFAKMTDITLIDTVKGDSMHVSPASAIFYGNQGNSINVSGRSYYIRKEGKNHYIYSDDLVNGITGIKVADISSLYIDFYTYGYGTAFLNETAQLLEYSVDLPSLILNAPYYIPFDYETINPKGFKKQIIIANTGGYLNTFSFTALPYPANGKEKKYDIWTSAISVKSFADRFRGIYPKARK